jgi:mycothiol synthase
VTSLSWHESLPAAAADQVRALAAAAAAADGVGPLSEQARLLLRPGAPRGHHLVAEDGTGAVAGYAALDIDETAGWRGQAEVVVDPARRRRGVATALAGELSAAAGRRQPARLGVWAHGDHPAAAHLAERFGFARDRVLWQMSLPRAEAERLPEPRPPAGVVIRAFTVGADEPEWLRVNAAAFATHPEQGRWTIDDLRTRESEPWFDPTGFFVAERDGQMVGFHWTKVDPSAEPDGPRGEVYVVGVRPDAAGGGLGRALTLIGVRDLVERGVSAVDLYVDEGNAPAVRMYERIGFAKVIADVSYGRTFQDRSVTRP